MPSPRNCFAMLIFPVVLAGSIAATIALMDAGMSATFAFGPPIAVVYLLVMALERALPFHRSW